MTGETDLDTLLKSMNPVLRALETLKKAGAP